MLLLCSHIHTALQTLSLWNRLLFSFLFQHKAIRAIELQLCYPFAKQLVCKDYKSLNMSYLYCFKLDRKRPISLTLDHHENYEYHLDHHILLRHL